MTRMRGRGKFVFEVEAREVFESRARASQTRSFSDAPYKMITTTIDRTTEAGESKTSAINNMDHRVV